MTVLPFPARPVRPRAPGADEVRVVHLPGDHTYVRHVSSPFGGPVASPVAGVPDWTEDPQRSVRALLAAGVDVVHVHFGFERCTPAHLAAVLDAWHAAGLPFVWTAHDLTNPHLLDQSTHEQQIGLLARRAAVVLTLTTGAAEEIERRWGRRAVVVPHPHLAPPEVMAAGRARQVGPPVVVVPLGMLRPGTDPAVVHGLLDVLGEREEVVLRVRLREEVLAPGFPRPDARLLDRLRRARREGRVDLRIGPRLDEDELWQELRGASALVLPYRWGSHSGWVESCHDVGTPVVAPALGHWSQQQDVHTFDPGAGTGSLAAALDRALAAGPRHGTVKVQRLSQRAHLVRAHELVHLRVAAGGGR